ncbi:N-acetylmuramoyl-L-alanine amidase [Pyxidicoccus fallax]|uniref:N-acetylmuramoyl-L-alanine amidase n=1 Tax=Pyxidicoccus fallax TaxID=394095 RepID=A0A848L8M3_9BACT|nr:N-acetylmuramoyl-L-alanine amidase [Pyxidicoccus fallax]NMO14907.1 N-acetylmuramoyl-L-alanine amidase [Pyxidicoccus fallax]NPC85529.1 N-acetylmuramoyl-L-alanine amidase [Pyxidicoccus fallax]
MPSPHRPLLAVLSLLCLVPVTAGAAERPARIVIDPGHGGSQEGAKGPGEMREKEVALQIAQRLRSRLEAAGGDVYLTRERDSQVSLTERVEMTNDHDADLFISIHANSMPTKRMRARTEGIETYFLSANASGDAARAVADRENAEAPVSRAARGDSTLAFILQDLVRTEAHTDSSRLAYSIHPRLIRATRAADRGVQQAPFFVLSGVECPAVLVEVGYISHPQEGLKLGRSEYQEKVAEAIADGVLAFLKDTRRRDAVRGPEVAGPVSR